MSLLKKVQAYKKHMDEDSYKKFEYACKMAVDLNAKNTNNFKSKDLAELQIKELADRHLMIQRREKSD